MLRANAYPTICDQNIGSACGPVIILSQPSVPKPPSTYLLKIKYYETPKMSVVRLFLGTTRALCVVCCVYTVFAERGAFHMPRKSARRLVRLEAFSIIRLRPFSEGDLLYITIMMMGARGSPYSKGASFHDACCSLARWIFVFLKWFADTECGASRTIAARIMGTDIEYSFWVTQNQKEFVV